MSRINTNINAMVAQRVLGHVSDQISTSLERLSTGLRINTGADDPAGLIASENLRSEMTAISSAISNAQRANQVLAIAEGGLAEVSSLLNELQGLVTSSANEAGLSQEEKEANQLQIDSILNTINRIANSTSFQGTKLLNGNFDYTTSGVSLSAVNDLNIRSAKIPEGESIGVNVNVVTSAQTGEVVLDTNGALSNGSLTIEVAGNNGLQQLTFASGATNSAIVAAVNTFTEVTGVSATTSNSDVVFNSTEFGSDQFVSVTKVASSTTGAYATAIDGGNSSKDSGRDAVVTINGLKASTDGLTATVSSSSLNLEITLDESINTAGGTTSFDITGGGATFQISPEIDLAGQASLAIPSVSTGSLGSSEVGYLSALGSGGSANVIDGDLSQAQDIVEAAIKQVASLRGRLGAFQSITLDSTIRSLQITFENTAAAESQIRDTDFAKATAELTRAQILSQAATRALQIANAQPRSVLSLLG